MFVSSFVCSMIYVFFLGSRRDVWFEQFFFCSFTGYKLILPFLFSAFVWSIYINYYWFFVFFLPLLLIFAYVLLLLNDWTSPSNSEQKHPTVLHQHIPIVTGDASNLVGNSWKLTTNCVCSVSNEESVSSATANWSA